MAAHDTNKSHWIFPLNSFLPNWVAIALNLATYGLIAVCLVSVIRSYKGSERILFAILISEVLTVPLKVLVSAPFAILLLWMQAFGSVVMFFAAVHIFLDLEEKKLESSG